MAHQHKDDMLLHQAKAVLDFNWTGEYTMPGPRLYPHQWSWDSALIALAYSRYDQDRAVRELRHLFEAQWGNGLLPQIVFNPRFTNYFPGPNFWHAKESPDAPDYRETSGVIQPPLHATAVLYVYRHAENGAGAKEFLEYAFPKLKAWHDSGTRIAGYTWTTISPATGPYAFTSGLTSQDHCTPTLRTKVEQSVWMNEGGEGEDANKQQQGRGERALTTLLLSARENPTEAGLRTQKQKRFKGGA